MPRMTPVTVGGSRASLVLLWLATAAISIGELRTQSAGLLQQTVVPTKWHDAVIGCGALLDTVMGFALWRWHRPAVYTLAVIHVLLMTVVATLLLPSLWLDPIGSLGKNVPIVALLWVLHEDAST